MTEQDTKERSRVADSQYAAPLATTGSNEVVQTTGPCGYQDVDCWVRQLHAAGWEAVAFRRGGPVVIPMGTTWRSPLGLLYRGPYLAWKVMKDPDYGRSNDGR